MYLKYVYVPEHMSMLNHFDFYKKQNFFQIFNFVHVSRIYLFRSSKEIE